ncbi:MAG TPA: hypothetical protein VHB46_00045 [Burkholderiales bacterium]|nr:hypothetical protein [Burkholderiales bacterium]
MKKFLALLSFLVLVSPARAAEDKMLYVEYRLAGPRIAADSFDAQVKKVWRMGDNFLRFEDAPNPMTKIHGLIIVAEPDIWVVDRKTSTAQHTTDPGPNYKVHFPLLASETSEKLRELEFGQEARYFQENGAKSLPAKEVDGLRCRLLQLVIDDHEVTLFLKPDDTPLQVVVKSPDYEYAVRFLRYEPDHRPDKSLFQVPADAKVKG